MHGKQGTSSISLVKGVWLWSQIYFLSLLGLFSQLTIFKNAIMLFDCPPKFCMSIAFIFSYAKFWTANKEDYGVFQGGLYKSRDTLKEIFLLSCHNFRVPIHVQRLTFRRAYFPEPISQSIIVWSLLTKCTSLRGLFCALFFVNVFSLVAGLA